MNQEKVHRSKRKYPKKVCLNPYCEYEREFTPHDYRQNYCCAQCRINFHNDQRRLNSISTFSEEKLLRQIDSKLRKLYRRYFNGKACMVHKAYFAHEEIDLSYLLTQEKVSDSLGYIRWLYQYGTQLDVNNKDYFIIHKRNK